MEDDFNAVPHEENLHQTYGNMIVLCQSKNSQPVCVLGPHYYIFLPTLLLFTGFLIFIIIQIGGQFTLFWRITSFITTGLFAISYLCVGFSNPGIITGKMVSEWGKPTGRADRECMVCGFERPPMVTHCRDCNVCIIQLDHHCPWIGKCVGRENKIRFYSFLACTFVSIFIFFIAGLSSRN